MFVIVLSEESGDTSNDGDDEVLEPGGHFERSNNHQSNHESTDTSEEHDTPVLDEALEEPSTNSSGDEANDEGSNERNFAGSGKREEHVSEAENDSEHSEEGKELKSEDEESSTNENEGKTEEDLKGTHEHSHGLQELKVHGLASVLRLSLESQTAFSLSSSPSEVGTSIISLALDVKDDVVKVSRALLAGSVRFEGNLISLIFTLRVVRVLALESRVVEDPLAFVVRRISRILFGGSNASSRLNGIESLVLNFAPVGADTRVRRDSVRVLLGFGVHPVSGVAEGTLEHLSSSTVFELDGSIGVNLVQVLNLLKSTETLIGLSNSS